MPLSQAERMACEHIHPVANEIIAIESQDASHSVHIQKVAASAADP
jgi:hypothetical protein